MSLPPQSPARGSSLQLSTIDCQPLPSSLLRRSFTSSPRFPPSPPPPPQSPTLFLRPQRSAKTPHSSNPHPTHPSPQSTDTSPAQSSPAQTRPLNPSPPLVSNRSHPRISPAPAPHRCRCRPIRVTCHPERSEGSQAELALQIITTIWRPDRAISNVTRIDKYRRFIAIRKQHASPALPRPVPAVHSHRQQTLYNHILAQPAPATILESHSYAKHGEGGPPPSEPQLDITFNHIYPPSLTFLPEPT